MDLFPHIKSSLKKYLNDKDIDTLENYCFEKFRYKFFKSQHEELIPAHMLFKHVKNVKKHVVFSNNQNEGIEKLIEKLMNLILKKDTGIILHLQDKIEDSVISTPKATVTTFRHYSLYGRIFTIKLLDIEYDPIQLLKLLVHEIRHVHQIQTNMLEMRYDDLKWSGKVYKEIKSNYKNTASQNNEYYSLPWENDAYYFTQCFMKIHKNNIKEIVNVHI